MTRLHFGRGEQWALIAAFAYTLVNVTLRAAAPHIDPFVGSLLRQLPVGMIAWAVVLARGAREFQPAAPAFLGRRFIAGLVAAGFISFVVGNVLYFRALAEGGLGITVSSVQAASVVSGIILGLVALGERPRSAQITGAGIIVVGLASVALAQTGTVLEHWYLGILFAAAAGTCYAAANAVTRSVQRWRPVLFVSMAAQSIGGLLPLFVIILARANWDVTRILGATDAGSVAAVLVAGCANALALAGLTQSVRYTTVASTNTVSSSTIVFSFVGSVLIFGETGSPPMVVGVILVAAGIVTTQLGRRVAPAAAPTAAAAQAGAEATNAGLPDPAIPVGSLALADDDASAVVSVPTEPSPLR